MNDCLSLPLRQGPGGIRQLAGWEAVFLSLGEGEAEGLPAGGGTGWKGIEVPGQLAATEGRQAVWYRTIQFAGSGRKTERYFSDYEARPLTWQIGVTPEDMARLTGKDFSDSPSWLPSKDVTKAPTSRSN